MTIKKSVTTKKTAKPATQTTVETSKEIAPTKKKGDQVTLVDGDNQYLGEVSRIHSKTILDVVVKHSNRAMTYEKVRYNTGKVFWF